VNSSRAQGDPPTLVDQVVTDKLFVPMSAIGPKRTFVFASKNTVGKAEKEKPGPRRAQFRRLPAAHNQSSLAQAIVRAHSWRKSLTDGTYNSIEDLAHAAGHPPKQYTVGVFGT
jgi:hypothetical protein